MPSGNTYTKKLLDIFKVPEVKVAASKSSPPHEEVPISGEQKEDLLEGYVKAAIEKLKENKSLMERTKNKGIPWRGFVDALEKNLPEFINAQDSKFDCIQ